MKRTISTSLRLLLCALALLCAFPSLTIAADRPTISQPRTYHYDADVALQISGIAVTATGVGDYDLVNRAFRVEVTTETAGERVRVQLVLVGGRLYAYDENQRRWEYVTLTEQEVDEFFAEVLSVPEHPTAQYVADGTERIGGDDTARWRASDTYNLLLPSLTPREFIGSFVEETLTIELAIGQANSYLYRATVQEQGKVTLLGVPNAPSEAVSSRLAYSYSNFDRPVTITAPEGAVPSDDPVDPAPPIGNGAAATLARAMIAPNLGQGMVPAFIRAGGR